LIQNGLLADPAGGLMEKKNLWIENGRIAAVTDAAPDADHVIDARGCIVSPGFIDIHMHEDPLDEQGRIRPDIFEAMLRMGVTTAVGGNCGLNVQDPVEYLACVERFGAPVNVALFAGHGYYRERAGARDKYAPITAGQKQHMLGRIAAALDAGCVGVSFGLRYIPGIDADELHETAALCGERGKLISAHVRDDAAQIFSAVEEIVQAGRQSGAPVQLSHIGSMAGFGQMKALLERIDAYRSGGMDVTCDCYPYAAFSTRIGETTYDDGWLDRYGCDYSACVPMEGKYRGQPCSRAQFEELRARDPECITVCHVMRREDVDLALRHSAVMLASDGLLDEGRGHPRAAGSFPRFWHERGRIGMDTLSCLDRMTRMPADRLGLLQKGRLTPGADADIAIFRPEAFRDRATFEQPVLPPEGMEWVIIGGEIALRRSEILNAGLGRALRF